VSSWTHRLGALVMVASLVWLATFLLTGESRRRFEAAVEAHLPALRALVSAD
jgi:heme A synthase